MNQKAEIIKYLSNLLDSRISEINAAIILLKESRDNESKSSAGDKYETGRAMAQIELDKIQQQLQNLLSLQAELLKIQPEIRTEKAGFGSLLSTTAGNYFISVGIGKIELGEEAVYAVSLASPIGQALKGTQHGDTITFNGKSIQILNVV